MAILVETSERVRIISLNRPDRHNALDDPTLEELPAAIAAASEDPAIDVILLRGEGRSFCSGRDMGVIDSGESGIDEKKYANNYEYIRAAQDHRLNLLGTAKPVVAALKGYVIGGGLELALAADIRIASDDARLSLPEVLYGISTDTGGAVLTTILAGPSRAKLLLMTGRKINADQSLAWGLVDEVVAPGELDGKALALCHEISKLSNTAVQISKQLVDQTWEGAIKNGLRAELLAQVALFADPAFKARADA
jgi:enoyl-CoA hydratase/carnithine racemase